MFLSTSVLNNLMKKAYKTGLVVARTQDAQGNDWLYLAGSYWEVSVNKDFIPKKTMGDIITLIGELPRPVEGRRTGKTLANVIKILINEKETIRITRDSAWRYTDDNRFGYAYVWEQAKILKMISDKLREKDVPVPEVKLIELW